MRNYNRLRPFLFSAFFAVIGNAATSTHAIDIAALVEQWSNSVMLVKNSATNGEKHLGTAFVVESDGLLVTNFHVVENAEDITIKSANGGEYRDAKVVAIDKIHDLAVLSVKANGLRPVKFVDDAKLKIGSDVIVIGNPAGLEQTVTEGIVSATRKVDGIDVIQISAAISSGSSGSPVFSGNGEVIGVATFKRVDGESLNFAIPSKHVEPLVKAANRNPDARPSLTTDGSIFTRSGRNPESAKQDVKLAGSPLFKELKSQESVEDYFAFLSGAKKAVEKHPESALAHRLLSDALYYIELNDEAIALAITAINLDPENPRGWNNLAILFQQVDDDEMVRKIYAHAVKIAPNDAKILTEYSELISEESPELAYSANMQAKRLILDGSGVDVETANYDLEWYVIDNFLNLGKDKVAFEAAKAFREKSPKNPVSWINYAYTAYYADHVSEVQPSIVEASKLDKSLERDPDLHALLGDVKVEEGDFHGAVSFFYKALAIDPNHLDALEGLIYARIDEAYSINFLEGRIEAEISESLRKIEAIDQKLARKLLKDINEIFAEDGIKFP